MEEVKILIFALVSFFSQENLPIAAKSAEIHIDVVNKQIALYQYDIYSLEQYKEEARKGLNTLMSTTVLHPDLRMLKLANKHFYEEDGKLNVVLHLQYDAIKDLRKISFYLNEEGILSYPYMTEYEYGLQTGNIDNRYVRFKADTNVKFSMQRKEYPFEGMYSLLDDWKMLEANKYEDMSEYISVKDFKKLRKRILKKGASRSFRNIENNNPHDSFDLFGAYLASTKVRHLNHEIRLPQEDYNELVLWGDGQFSLYLFDGHIESPNANLELGKVYYLKSDHLNKDTLLTYLKALRSKL